jgi:hypothetical protein
MPLGNGDLFDRAEVVVLRHQRYGQVLLTLYFADTLENEES